MAWPGRDEPKFADVWKIVGGRKTLNFLAVFVMNDNMKYVENVFTEHEFLA